MSRNDRDNKRDRNNERRDRRERPPGPARGRDRTRRERPPGAVWDTPPERLRRGPRPAVTREQIVAAGIAVADAEGLDALSMRRVAHDLRVGTMTLYTHVANKDELLDLMQDEIMAEVLLPGEVPRDWRVALTEIAQRTARVWVEHEWIASDMSRRPLPGPNALMHVEQSVAAVEPLGVDERTATAVLAVVDDYAIGYAMRTIGARRWRWQAEAPTTSMLAEQPPYLARLLASGDYPRLSEIAARSGFSLPREDRFELGLAWLLDGIEAALVREG